MYPEYDLWDEVTDDWWWADRFGWPPSVVEDLPPEVFWRMRHVDNQAAAVRKAAQEKS